MCPLHITCSEREKCDGRHGQVSLFSQLFGDVRWLETSKSQTVPIAMLRSAGRTTAAQISLASRFIDHEGRERANGNK